MSKRFYYDEFLEEIYDEQIDDYPSNQSICGILNQQSQRIAELEDKWNKLREWARNSTEVLLYSINDRPAKLGNKKYNYFYSNKYKKNKTRQVL